MLSLLGIYCRKEVAAIGSKRESIGYHRQAVHHLTWACSYTHSKRRIVILTIVVMLSSYTRTMNMLHTWTIKAEFMEGVGQEYSGGSLSRMQKTH